MTGVILCTVLFLFMIIGKVSAFIRLSSGGGVGTIRSLGFGATWKPTSSRVVTAPSAERDDHGQERSRSTRNEAGPRETSFRKDGYSRDRTFPRGHDDFNVNTRNNEHATDRRPTRSAERAPYSDVHRRNAYDSNQGRSERAQYSEAQYRNAYVHNQGKSNSYERMYQPRHSNEQEEKREPVYGYYDGDHIYGVSSVRLALLSGRRQIKELLVQQGMDISNKKDSKTPAEILALAAKNNIEIREFSKHDLNMLTDNRPHQGFVLRAQPLSFSKLTTLEPSANYSCVLALDEVWDPQNFGALLRTAYFLRCDKVVVCSKNSAPLSPAVSKASAGAMELMEVYSTDNLMKFLDTSKANGWQVVGTDLNPKSISLYEVPRQVPTILVLGNEGHGIRTNILRRCTHLVRLGNSPHQLGSDGAATDVSDNGASDDSATDVNKAALVRDRHSNSGDDAGSEIEAVDSLNVSVTGAIILHHFLASKQ